MLLSWNLGTLTSWNSLGHSRPVTGLLYLYLLYSKVQYVRFKYKILFTSSKLSTCFGWYIAIVRLTNKMKRKYWKLNGFEVLKPWRYIVMYTLLCIHCYVYIVMDTLLWIHCYVYIVMYTLLRIHCYVYIVMYTLLCIHCYVYIVMYTIRNNGSQLSE